MSQCRPRHGYRLPALLMLLFSASSCGVAGADQEPAPPDAPSLEAKVEELTLRLLGMEGKLKESAHARKSAEQARMEAERRLAEGAQETERLSGEIQRLKEAQLELEKALSERDQRLSQLDARWLSLSTAHEALNTRLESLRARVPTQDGGTLDPEPARQLARDAYEDLRAVLQRPRSGRDPEIERAISAAEKALHQRQFTLARALDAQSVYRVRPNDSLALISTRCYGESSQWRAIFLANRHVLEDPDQLTPGVTLVVP
jgi:nucleoid-associated protein YgaU